MDNIKAIFTAVLSFKTLILDIKDHIASYKALTFFIA